MCKLEQGVEGAVALVAVEVAVAGDEDHSGDAADMEFGGELALLVAAIGRGEYTSTAAMLVYERFYSAS